MDVIIPVSQEPYKDETGQHIQSIFARLFDNRTTWGYGKDVQGRQEKGKVHEPCVDLSRATATFARGGSPG